MVVQRTGYDLVAGFPDGCQLLIGHFFGLQPVVRNSSRLFQYSERVGDLAGHCFNADPDFEILVASLGLRRPVSVGRDLYLAHRIVFYTVFHIR